jgi:hypothetical protein
MRVAVCFSGMIRTGVQASSNVINFIGDALPNCEFFLHTWEQQSYRPPLGRHTLDGTAISDTPLLDFCKIYNIKQYQVSGIDTIGNNTLHPLWYSWSNSVRLTQHGSYDYVVKLRPDIIFNPQLKLSNMLSRIQHGIFYSSHVWPFNKDKDLTMEDVLFISDTSIMNTAIEFAQTTTRSLDNHADFCKYMSRKNIEVQGLDTCYFRGDYSILRPEFAHLDPVIQYQQCEKGDKNIFYPEDIVK